MAEEHSFEAAFRRFCRVLDLAEGRFAGGRADEAVALAQIAARIAYPAEVGLFASARLERLLIQLGQTIPAGSAPAPRRPASPLRVLHVLSYARPIGGDTRFAWRWILEDADNTHSVAVTTQADLRGTCEIPPHLEQAVRQSGGSVHFLDAATPCPLKQAAELRRLCQSADIVALHLFPYDVVPILALSAGCDSIRTIFVDHSDHTFWIGASVAHLIAHLRTQSPDFLRRCRGVVPERSVLLPIPLAYKAPLVSRSEAKRLLGYRPEDTILLTIASPFKYSAPGRLGLLDLAVPVLKEHREALLLAVGPTAEGPWGAASAQTDGRIVALGERYENALLYAAADIYLDSVPFSSITSLLEAGCHGAPLLGYAPPDADLWQLGPGAPGLEGTMEMAADADSYRRLLGTLIADKDYRAQRGDHVQARILAGHTGEGWMAFLNNTYSSALLAEQRECTSWQEDVFISGPLTHALSQLYGTKSAMTNTRQLLWRFCRRLPYTARVSLVLQLCRYGFGFSLLNLLPLSINILVRDVIGLARDPMKKVKPSYKIRNYVERPQA